MKIGKSGSRGHLTVELPLAKKPRLKSTVDSTVDLINIKDASLTRCTTKSTPARIHVSSSISIDSFLEYI